MSKITELSSLLIALLLALACGGGSTNNGSARLMVKVAQPEDSARSKLAPLPPGTPVRINTDNTDRADPNEADDIRVYILNSDREVTAEVFSKMERTSEAPYTIIESSRQVLLDDIPPGENLELVVELGQDLGRVGLGRKAEIFYSGNVKNISINSLGDVLLEGQPIENLAVDIGIHIDPRAETFILQGFADYRDIPDAVLSSRIPNDPRVPVATLFALADELNWFVLSKSLADIDQPLSQFFEVNGIPSTIEGLFINVQSGDPDNFVMTAFIPQSELKLGKPVLVDWESTFTSNMTQWMYFDDPLQIDQQTFEDLFQRNLQVYAYLQEKLKTAETEPVTISPRDAIVFKMYQQVAELSKKGDPLGIILSPSNFTNKVVTILGFEPESGINSMFLDKGLSVRLLGNGFDEVHTQSIPDKDENFRLFVSGNIRGQAYFDLVNQVSPLPETE